ncbi:MAG: PQQ-dependent sugar dehydrogenase [Alphaproteobacteria bacterium]
MKFTAALALIPMLGIATIPAKAAETFDTKHGKITVETVADGLRNPWGIDFLPDGRMIVTEKVGTLRIVTKDGRKSKPILGGPLVGYVGQGGLLDVTLHPDFKMNRLVFLTYSELAPDRSVYTAMMRGKLRADDSQLDDTKVLFRQSPKVGNGRHFGSRVLVAPDGNLFLTTGDLGNRHLAQDLGGHVGKVIRLTVDGGIPRDNPFVGKANARPEIWSYGHRNIQGADIHPATGKLWTIEHGPRGGDEINIPEAGANYGWPLVSHGIEYSGEQIGDGKKFMDGVVPPVTTWTPVIAPGGMTFYTADMFPAWKGNLLIGGLRAGAIVRLELDGEKVVGEERLLRQIGNRIRDVAVGPDGAVYALDESDGRILRITPTR